MEMRFTDKEKWGVEFRLKQHNQIKFNLLKILTIKKYLNENLIYIFSFHEYITDKEKGLSSPYKFKSWGSGGMGC